MGDTERYQRGKEVRAKVLGDEGALPSDRDPVELRLDRLATEFGWGEIWAGQGLDLRLRSLCAIAILATRCHLDELRTYTIGALRCGVTSEEIREALLQVRVCAGAAVAREAVQVVRDTLVEQGAICQGS